MVGRKDGSRPGVILGMRYLYLVAAAGLALVALAAPASAASTASIQGDTLTVNGDGGRDGIMLERDVVTTRKSAYSSPTSPPTDSS